MGEVTHPSRTRGVQIAAEQALPAATAVLAATLAFGCVRQGGFAAGDGRTLAIGAVVAALVACAAVPPTRIELLGAPLLPAAAFAVWAVIAAAIAGPPASPRWMVQAVVACAAAFVVARRTSGEDREVLLTGLAVLAAVLALTGWWGVAAHDAPQGLPGNGLWRAASTITYANATAAVLVPVLLVTVARFVRHRSRLEAVLAATMAMGIAATMSRAGLACLLLGLAVLAGLLGVRKVLVALAPIAVGAGIATAGLLPSLPEASSGHPAIAVAALVVGAAATWWLTAQRPTFALLAAGAMVALLAVAPVLLPSAREAFDVVGDGRITFASPDRADMLRGAADLARERPLVGVGPGLAGFAYHRDSGERVFAHFAHNEYLQVWLELGLVGAAILAWGIAATGRAVLRSPERTVDRARWAGVVAAATAMGLHAAVDFVWHVPVVPIVGAVLLGSSLPAHPRGPADVPVEADARPAPDLRQEPPTQRHTRSTA